MLICPNCGTANTDDSKFCENCGTTLEGVTGEVPEGNGDGSAEPEVNLNIDDLAQGPGPDMEAGRPPRRKMSRLQIAVILEAVCLVLLVSVFYVVGSSRGSAMSVAEKYFQAYADQDWEEVYSMLDLPDSEFVREAQYEQVMEASQQPQITNFKVQEPAAGMEDGITQTFQVDYSIKGQGQSSTTVTLVRQSEKSMLFFDTWKVSGDSLIAQDYLINVPEGAIVAVDGVQLDEDQMSGDDEDIDCYQISIFKGVHSIQAEIPWCETYEAQFEAASQSEYTVSGLTVSEEGQQALETKLQQAMEACCKAALAGKSFDEVKDLFAEGAPAENENYYENLRSSLEADKYSSAQQLQLSGFECELDDVGNYSAGLHAQMSYDYNITYTYQGIFDDSVQNRTKDGSSYASAQFVYDGDTYKLWSFAPGSIWY